MTQKDGKDTQKPIGMLESFSVMLCVLGLLLAYQLDSILKVRDVEATTRIAVITLYDYFLSIGIMAVGLVFLYHMLNMWATTATAAKSDETDYTSQSEEETTKSTESARQSLKWLAKVLGYAIGMPLLATVFWALVKTTGGHALSEWNEFAAGLMAYTNGWLVIKATVWFFRLRYPKRKKPKDANEL